MGMTQEKLEEYVNFLVFVKNYEHEYGEKSVMQLISAYKDREEKKLSFSDDLKKLEEWLKSENGRQILKMSQERAEREWKTLMKDTTISPEKLREPFDI